ncbi:pyruvate dehydrogenase complex dihydrolipoamide acetyltransferase [Shumkonia mesophila]|uniref:pyruvate dehydrogenase complex dihydrolipoamide acetyltransferase n=1 Tax=Shumkonia mesophila TaxID=2838854 RepID=UPI002934D764|nr:pyruvate dehydrogenase complex dihydrolipoamide acetyltransferase [Shumkonia mesophila]
MAIQILMPALSPTMTDGKLAKWLKKEGDAVASGDVIAEIETDKATMEMEAVDEGTIGKILVPEGSEGVAVNAPIAVLLEEGEDASAIEAATSPAKAPEKPAAPAPAAAKPAAPAPAPAQPAAAPAAKPQPAPAGDRVLASPLARRMAEQAGLDLAQVAGSGPQGRIVKADVEKALAGGAPMAAPAPAAAAKAPSAPAPAPQIAAPYTEVPNSSMRKVIARRLSESKQTIPHFYLTVDCEIDALLALRKQLNAKAPEGEGAYKLSVNDFVVRAVALALRQVPAANATWTDQAVLRYDEVDVSVAVATPNGLITPVVRKADTKGLVQISREMKDLGQRARDGKLVPEDYQGGGFTISNMGMLGIKSFSAIINPPQSCILAVGAGEPRPVVKDGALAVATVMTVTLSVDHRSVDGAIGAEFLVAFKRMIDDPLTMLL